jgi:GT2 family glycosyltransferase
LGVAIAAYRSEGFIADCLTALFASTDVRLRVVVVDNASDDGTVETVRRWAQGRSGAVSFAEAPVGEIGRAEADLTLLRAPVNGGFAYATNRALEVLVADPAIGLFWVLNPDCQPCPEAAAKFAAAGSDGAFSLMGGRTLYLARPDLVQTDGGRVSMTTGVCHSVNGGLPESQSRVPGAAEIDYITGASCVASRRFLETVGLMREDYFLYYEEVDWALRRGALPLRQAPDAVVLHYGGATIGSGSFGTNTSPFTHYFNYRNRVRFMRRYAPVALPMTYAYAVAKALQLALSGARDEARAVIAGTFSRPPPSEVREMVDPAARAIAFG